MMSTRATRLPITHDTHTIKRTAQKGVPTASAVSSISSIQDPQLPALPQALDPQVMQVKFQELLFGGTDHRQPSSPKERYTVAKCEIERIKYRAAEKCVISYRLQIHDERTGQDTSHWFCARVFPVDVAESRYHKALREPLTPPRFGHAVMFLSALEMVIWAFPNDRKIAGVPKLITAAAGQNDTLATLVDNGWTDSRRLRSHQYKLIHYVPEHTCTVRVDLTVATGSAEHVTSIFGKAYYNDEGAETFRLMQRLWHSPTCQNGHLRIARPLAYETANKILWQSGLPGRTLLTYELGSAHFDQLLVAAAQTVAQLHASLLPCARITTQQEYIDLIAPRTTLTSNLCPHLTREVMLLSQSLRHLAPLVCQEPTATLHGDLHLQNFFVDEAAPAAQQIALIDLDNLSIGSPWRDLGSFVAGLYYRSLVDGVSQPRIQVSIERFLDSYATQVPWRFDRRAVDWYTAASLLNERTFRAISRLKEGRLAMVDDFIRIANAVLVG